MRRVLSIAFAIAFLAGPAFGQSREKMSFRSVRVGFAAGKSETGDGPDFAGGRPGFLYKSGGWVPIIVDVLATAKYDPKEDGPVTVSVQVLDCDETLNTYDVQLPPFDKDTLSSSAIVYTRPGTRYGEFTVSLTNVKGRSFCKDYQTSTQGLGSHFVLYLALGSRVPGLKLPGNANNALQRSEIGLVPRVGDMPPDWFGYGSADVVILSTRDRSFVNELAADQIRCKALAEWVRRGGNLVVSLGSNRDAFIGDSLGELSKVLPLAVEGKPYVVPTVSLVWKDGARFGNEPLRPTKGAKDVELTKFVPRPVEENRSYYSLMDGPAEGGGSPLVAQGAFGLGRVTCVAFDIDASPFAEFKAREVQWEKLLSVAGPRPNHVSQNQFNFGRNFEEGDAELASLVSQLENFEGVPVISFGWVALFILLYIIIVGPLDYFFLKKVVKRLELTWITFPTVVIAVSTAAYFAAYYLKGSELRINKLDIVDYDLTTKRAYGHTWLSVFSPRIQKYTVGLEPASPEWTAVPQTPGEGTVVSWMGAPKQGRQSLFRHSYAYAPKAEGLDGVPIQVWSTKGFQGDWVAPLDATKPSFDGTRLRHPPGKPNELIGSVISHLPVALEDAIMIYRGEVATLGRLEPETPKSVTAQDRVPFANWRNNQAANDLRSRLLFHERTQQNQQEPNNGSMRSLDQSWRIRDDNRDEVIVVGRLAQSRGNAEDMTAGPAMAGRLWLGKLPSSGGPRPATAGTLRQDTIVRAFLPVPHEPDVK
ncbi:MAG: hypothetical protein U0746_12935 [Gemmataceae bacterium]